MRHSWLLLVQVGCSVVMTQKTTALHMKNPCQGYHLHFWAGLKKLTLPKCLEGLKPLFSQKQEDNDGITDTRKTSTTVWDWGVEEAFQPAVFKLLYRGFFKATCARRTCYNSPTNILDESFNVFQVFDHFEHWNIFFWKGLFVRSKCFCECYLGILRLKNASFV